MSYAVLDTNIASLSVKGEMPASIVARLRGAIPAITFVSVGELTKWTTARDWGWRRRGALDDWIGQRVIIKGDDKVARRWGALSAAAARRGRPRPENDTWVAACCLAENLPLATLNIKDFVDFADHEGLVLL